MFFYQISTLTAGQDAKVGTSGDDTFTAHIFDNQNTLQSGDSVDGGLGHDTLTADLGTSHKFAITPEIKNVEVVKFRVEANDTSTSGGNNIGNAHIDAERIAAGNGGKIELWSDNSRADLKIEDVRINSSQVTVGMGNTDPGDVDYSVFFDPSHLTSNNTVATGSVLNLQLMDTRSAVAGLDPLKENPYNGFAFMLDGKLITVSSPDIDKAVNYDQFLAAVTAAVKATPGLEKFTVKFGSDFTAIDTLSGKEATGKTIELVNNGGGTITTGETGTGWTANGPVPPSSGLHTGMDTGKPAADCPLIQTNVVLDNVGRVNWVGNGCDPANTDYGSEAGDLLIGSMATRGGVERFDVLVKNGSWLNSMESTNDTLENVTITAGSTGNLYIGGNSDNNSATNDSMTSWTDAPIYLEEGGLTNVRTFDAHELGDDAAKLNNVKLNAVINDKAFDKYLNKLDTDTNAKPDADTANNADFKYTTGSGDDALNFTVSGNVMADSDVTLDIVTGAGNDNIKLDFTAKEENGNWQTSQHDLHNITIDAGDGNDVIKTPGSGHVTILAGAGDDTVYTDNTGAKAVYVLNAANTPHSLLVKYDGTKGVIPASNDVAAMNHSFAFAAVAGATDVTVTVKVTYHGVVGEFKIPVTTLDATFGFSLTDLQINQAIKQAINSDAELSKLMVAKDGAGHSLILEALVDGAGDLHVDFNGTYKLPTDAANAPLHDLTGAGTTGATGLDAIYTEHFGESDLSGTKVQGGDSTAISDNIINLGSGDDIAILGTGANSNDTIVFEAANNGNDTIVNFVAAGTDRDFLDFSKALGLTKAEGITYAGFTAGTSGTLAGEHMVVALQNVLKATSTTDWQITDAASLQAALNGKGTEAYSGMASTAKGHYVFLVYDDATKASFKLYSATGAADGNFTVTEMSSVDFAGWTATNLLTAFGTAGSDVFNKPADALINTGGGTTGTASHVYGAADVGFESTGAEYFDGLAASFIGTSKVKLNGGAVEIQLLDGIATGNHLVDFTNSDGMNAHGTAHIHTIKLANVENTVTMGSHANNLLYNYVGGSGIDTFNLDNTTTYAKTIKAGAGNDVFKVLADKAEGATLDGGAGTGDKLVITDTVGTEVDYSHINLRGIEIIDSTGLTTAAALKFDAADLADVTSMVIKGSTNNTLTLVDTADLSGIEVTTGYFQTLTVKNGTTLDASFVNGTSTTTINGAATADKSVTIVADAAEAISIKGLTTITNLDAITLKDGAGNNTITLSDAKTTNAKVHVDLSTGGSDTVEFAAAASGNAATSITGFKAGATSAGGDRLNIHAALAATVGGIIGGSAGGDISGDTVISTLTIGSTNGYTLTNKLFVYTGAQSDLSALIDGVTGGNGKHGLADGGHAVALIHDSATDTTYDVYEITGVSSAADTFTKVGTVGVDGDFTAANIVLS